MKIISITSISVDKINLQVVISSERFDIDKVNIKYMESGLFSYLEITSNTQSYLTKGLKSFWEHLRISTYDAIEKREDNKIYNLYCHLTDIKSNTSRK